MSAVNLDAIPIELRERAHWVVWKRERRAGKWTKVPYRAVDGRTKAEVDNPRTWGTFEQAVARADQVQGIGYVFSADDPFAGVDLDACIDSQTGELHPAAAEILDQLDSYRERSPSHAGVHAIVVGKVNGDRHRTTDTPWGGEFEVYDQGRFFTVTGNGAGAIRERQAQLDGLVERMFGKPVSNGAGPTGQGPSGPARSVEQLLGEFPQLTKIVKRQGKAPKDPSPSGWDHWLACASVRLGLSDGDIAALIGHARLGDPKGARQDYIERTIRKARETAEVEASDPAQQISKRWNLQDDPIVSGSSLGDIASGSAIIYLERRKGKRLRFPRLGDLFDARAHTRIVSLVARAKFPPLTNAEATEIAQLIIALCGGEDDDPRDEACQWVTDFIAYAGATIDALKPDGTPKPRWDVVAEYKQVEGLLPRGPDAARGSVIIRKGNELWLPAGKLKEHSKSRMVWGQFTSCLAEIGWRHQAIDLREPGTRDQRADGSKADRFHRNFYVGTD